MNQNCFCFFVKVILIGSIQWELGREAMKGYEGSIKVLFLKTTTKTTAED